MDIDATLKERFAIEAEAMEDRQLELESVLRQGRRTRTGTRVIQMAAIAAALVVTSLAVSSLTGSTTTGDTFTDVAMSPGQGSEVLVVEARDALTRFLKEAGDRDGGKTSWEMLTSDAQERIGSLRTWDGERQDVYSFLSWVLSPDVEIVLTRFPPASGDRFVATAVAKATGGRALLQPIPLVETADGFSIDLPSTSFSPSISLEPLNPRFMAGVAPADCSGENCYESPDLPFVRDGDLFGVALEPSEDVADVWFAIGSEWIATANLDVSDRRVVAEATFEGDGVTPGEQVFLVAIRTDEAFETYGYRVTFEE